MSIATDYLKRLECEPEMRSALLACSVALRLNDQLAGEAIKLVAETNGSTSAVLERVKRLGCVRERWDGEWYVAEDVRVELATQLVSEVSPITVRALRGMVAQHADDVANKRYVDGQLAVYQKRAANFESAYQLCLEPERVQEGAERLEALWDEARGSGKLAVIDAANRVAPEIDRRFGSLPPVVRFFQGMAAYRHRNRARAASLFKTLWHEGQQQSGQPSKIFAIAAHLYGSYERDREIAEKALTDSITWYLRDQHRAQVYHSLGNLLSRNTERWEEAEAAYNKSLEFDADAHRAQVYASRARAILETGQSEKLDKAAEFARNVIDLNSQDAKSVSIAYKILAEVHERRGEWAAAAKAVVLMMESDRLAGETRFIAKHTQWLSELNVKAEQASSADLNVDADDESEDEEDSSGEIEVCDERQYEAEDNLH